MEYERRFRLDRLPPGLDGPSHLIRQAYWTLGNGWVLRIRLSGDEQHRFDPEIALKGPRHGMGRPEFEFFLAASRKRPSDDEVRLAAQQLFQAASGNVVVKTRHSYLAADGIAWDIDEFHTENSGLLIAEAESELIDEVARIKIPSWAVDEVTDDNRYNNESLAFQPFGTW